MSGEGLNEKTGLHTVSPNAHAIVAIIVHGRAAVVREEPGAKNRCD